MTTADRIRDRIAAAGLTQEQVADATGYHHKQVGRWVTGVAQPRADALTKLAGLFGCDMHELIGGDYCHGSPARYRPDSNPALLRIGKLHCATCEGRGWVELVAAARAETPGHVLVLCPDCFPTTPEVPHDHD